MIHIGKQKLDGLFVQISSNQKDSILKAVLAQNLFLVTMLKFSVMKEKISISRTYLAML